MTMCTLRSVDLRSSSFDFVFMPELLDVLIELPLCSADLLRNQIGAVLQVVTDVTHVMFPQFSIRLQGQSRTVVPANPSEAVDYQGT